MNLNSNFNNFKNSSSKSLDFSEKVVLALAIALASILGFSNLGAPSIWHDEAVHIFVARSITETGVPRLPSGLFYFNGIVFHYLLALFIKIFGVGETIVRTPSVLISILNVVLCFMLVRTTLGSFPAKFSALALAVAPWQVSWAREARFYTLQQFEYLVFLLLVVRMIDSEQINKPTRWLQLLMVYLAGIGTSLHSILFMTVPATFSFIKALIEKSHKKNQKTFTIIFSVIFLTIFMSSVFISFTLGGIFLILTFATCLLAWYTGNLTCAWSRLFIASTFVITLTFFSYYFFLSQFDHDAIFREGGLTGKTASLLADRDRADNIYYIRFLLNNMSRGFLILSCIGFIGMFKRKNAFLLIISFWIPILALSFIGYRQHRFMFFTFPIYIVSISYGIKILFSYAGQQKSTVKFLLITSILIIFAARLIISSVRLVNDSITIAEGAHTTLAKQHPRWREPCQFVRKYLKPDTKIIATDCMPVLYYVGRCDNWFSSKVTPWEWIESGLPGIPDAISLKEFMEDHPSGFFLAEHRKFWYVKRFIPEEINFVKEHMLWIKQASNPDVSIFAWGTAAESFQIKPTK